MSKKARSGKFESLADVARRLLEKRMGQRLAAYDAVKVWPRAVGEHIAKRCIALGIKSGILYVSVPNNVWLTELRVLKKQLIESVNEKLGKNVVRDLSFKIGVRKRQEHG
jgi:predicted nucleic acid-binding Zn ribbon protein